MISPFDSTSNMYSPSLASLPSPTSQHPAPMSTLTIADRVNALTAWFKTCPYPLACFLLFACLQSLYIYQLAKRRIKGQKVLNRNKRQSANGNGHLSLPPPETPTQTPSGDVSAVSAAPAPASSLSLPPPTSSLASLAPSSSAASSVARRLIEKRPVRPSVHSCSDPLLTSALDRSTPTVGYLKKRAGGVLGGWQRRYFVLDHSYLKYFATWEDAISAGITCGPGGTPSTTRNPLTDAEPATPSSNGSAFAPTPVAKGGGGTAEKPQSTVPNNNPAAARSIPIAGLCLAAVDVSNLSPVADPKGRTFTLTTSDGSASYWLRAENERQAVMWTKAIEERRSLINKIRMKRLAADKEAALAASNALSGVGGGANRDVASSSSSSNNGGVEATLAALVDGKKKLTEDERRGVLELLVVFPVVDVFTLLRFLRASKLVVPDAVAKLENHLRWRQETFPIAFESVKADCACGKYVLCGRDKDGDVVVYLQGHEMGPHTYTTIEEHMKSVYFLLEIVCTEILDHPMDKFTIVYNRMEATTKNRDLKWAENIGKSLQQHYPERMKRAYVVPANVVFRALWSIVKIFFDPDTAEKVAFLSGPNELKKYIKDEQLPVELGGTCEYKYDVEHLFTKLMPGYNKNKGTVEGAPLAQKVYSF